jgi:tRNA pseudouridine38-40 synthase
MLKRDFKTTKIFKIIFLLLERASVLVSPLSTFNYRLKITYDGSAYEGWQVQPEGHKTIQGEINKALIKISKSEDISTLGSGRTDSGVHALGQIAVARIPLSIEPNSLLKALNSHLPKDIRVLEVGNCESEFHPVRDALWKRYTYLISCEDVVPPHLRWMVSNFPGAIDWPMVEKALKVFEGEHDFINFSTKGTEVNSTIRTIFLTRLENKIVEVTPGSEQKIELKKLTFEGSGFLKQMVRLLVGTVVAAGQNKVTLEQISEHLLQVESKKLAAVAPASGLYLDHVEYDMPHAMTH